MSLRRVAVPPGDITPCPTFPVMLVIQGAERQPNLAVIGFQVPMEAAMTAGSAYVASAARRKAYVIPEGRPSEPVSIPEGTAAWTQTRVPPSTMI